MIRRVFIGGALLQAACAPTLDWREVRLPSGAVAAFPCKPSHDSRRVRLAGRDVEMTLHSCTAAGATWALSDADVLDPSKVASTLDAMSTAVVRNIRVEPSGAASAPFDAAGMTPNPRAAHLRATGKTPDGGTVTLETAVFAKGTRVFQATILAPRLDEHASQTFFTSLRLP
jgi:hypothetical protein